MSEASRWFKIFRYVTNKNILDIQDALNVEPRHSKIRLTLVEYDKNFKATVQVRHFADADMFKLVCWDILTRQFPQTFALSDSYQHRGDPKSRPLARWIEHKGSPVEGGFEARILEVQYLDPQQWKHPYSFRILRGPGEQIGQGAVKMVQVQDEVSMLLPEVEARRMALTVFDYIRAWEMVNLRLRHNAYFAGREAGREPEIEVEDWPGQAVPEPVLPSPAEPSTEAVEEAVLPSDDFFDSLFGEPPPPRRSSR
ncbi:MAG: hypothetical protein ACUVYA_07715 [Planctomycetota bacterium]